MVEAPINTSAAMSILAVCNAFTLADNSRCAFFGIDRMLRIPPSARSFASVASRPASNADPYQIISTILATLAKVDG